MSMGATLELRHLRYFIAVAEAGSMTIPEVTVTECSEFQDLEFAPNMGRDHLDPQRDMRALKWP